MEDVIALYLLQTSVVIGLTIVVTGSLMHGCAAVHDDNEHNFWMSGLALGLLALGGVIALVWLVFDPTIQFRIMSSYWAAAPTIPYGMLPGLHIGAILIGIVATIFVWTGPRVMSTTH